MDLVSLAKFVILPIALGAVAVVLLMGLTNMVRGGPPERSQQLMRWRVGLQFVALCLVAATIWLMNRG